MRINRVYAALVTAVLALFASVRWPPVTQAAVGNLSPSAFHDSQGVPHTLAELRGHPAVINFWATWCAPCKEELPRLQKLSDSYTSHGVHFITISLDSPETQDKVESVTTKRSVRLPVWLGATDTTLTQLHLGVLVPATLILDENGETIGRIEGEGRDKDIRSRLDWLLAGRAGKQPKLVQKNDW